MVIYHPILGQFETFVLPVWLLHLEGTFYEKAGLKLHLHETMEKEAKGRERKGKEKKKK